MTVYLLNGIVGMWRSAEQRRAMHEKAEGALTLFAGDVKQILTQENISPGDVPRVKLLGLFHPGTGGQEIYFTRAFELGPERSVTFAAGDGVGDSGLEGAAAASAKGSGGRDREIFTGLAGDLKALGGMADVGWFLENETLFRAIRSPAGGAFQSLRQLGKPVAENMLYLGFDYWDDRTTVWASSPSSSGKSVVPAFKQWNSLIPSKKQTFRGYFPKLIRATVTSALPMPRCVHTKLAAPLTADDDGVVEVWDTRGFADGGTEQSYLLIGDEWIKYDKRDEYRFSISERGARGTARRDHQEDALVRFGQTHGKILYLNKN
jgi:hypothetical protein